MVRAKKLALLGAVFATAVLAAVLLLTTVWTHDESFTLLPKPKATDGGTTHLGGTIVGTGWSVSENPATAVQETLAMALAGQPSDSADFVVLFASAGSDTHTILQEARHRLGAATRIYGGTSDSRGVMTDRGYVQVSDRGYEVGMEGRRGLTALAVTSPEIRFGVGAADFADYPSVREAGKAAVTKAIASAGKTPAQPPRVVLTSFTIGDEEDGVAGIEDVVGPSTVVLGGTVGGPAMSVFGNTEVYERGASVAVLYTDLPMGWTFEGGFDVTDTHTGIVTKVEGQAIIEIDGRPALDVYDAWLGGQISGLFQEKARADRIRDLLTLCPIYRKVTSPSGEEYQLFSHPWPRDPTGQDKAVMTSTRIKPGERVYLSRGTWETLLNRGNAWPQYPSLHGGGGVFLKTPGQAGLHILNRLDQAFADHHDGDGGQDEGGNLGHGP
jgi:hypothetical protein